jgi:hypothetical protein
VIEVPDGLKARVTHRRYVESEDYEGDLFTRYEWQELGLAPKPRGGVTEAELLRGEEVVATGQAVCSPEDQYVARIGRDKAVGRAISDYIHSR